jgi:DNA-binding FrmR family transcriptional regulator
MDDSKKTTCEHCTPTNNCCRTTHREESERKLLYNRCSRLEGQIRGIKGMIEKDAYCDDILNQIAAAQSALQGLSRVILENHMKSCLITRIQDGELEVVDELLTTIQKMMK